MPTLKEALAVCKDRIVVNIDQGYQYYDLVMAITEELGVTEQILIKGKKPVDFVDAQAKKYKHAMMYMPIIDINKTKRTGIIPPIYGQKKSSLWLMKYAGNKKLRK